MSDVLSKKPHLFHEGDIYIFYKGERDYHKDYYEYLKIIKENTTNSVNIYYFEGPDAFLVGVFGPQGSILNFRKIKSDWYDREPFMKGKVTVVENVPDPGRFISDTSLYNSLIEKIKTGEYKLL